MQTNIKAIKRFQSLSKDNLHILWGCLILAVTAAVFVPVLNFDFVAWDDALHVQANPRMQTVAWKHLSAFWSAPYEHLYIPLTYTVWTALAWSNRLLDPGPLNASWFHGFNLIVHLVSVWIVFVIGNLVCKQSEPVGHRQTLVAAAAAALVFGLHPLQVEAVAWVSGLKDVLSGCWALVTLWQYLVYLQSSQESKRKRHYGIASLAFGLALLSKPAAVVVPALAWVMAIGSQGLSWRQATRTVWAWVAVAAIWGVLTKGLQPDDALVFSTPIWARLVFAADAVAFYAQKIVWPFNLGPDYGRTPQIVIGLGWPLVAALGPLVLGAVIWRCRRQWPGLALAAGIFVVALLPVLGFVSFIFQAFSTVADRYLYLAMLGPALGFGWVLQRVGRTKPARIIAVLVLGLLTWRSADQVQVWWDTETLFTHALRINPRSALAHNNLGLTLAQQGKLDAALVHYRAALQFRPNVPEVHYNLGNTLLRQGQVDQAIAHYVQAIQIRPTWPEAHNNLGSALDDRGRRAEAMAHYQIALRLNPAFAEAHNNLGDTLLASGKVEEATEQFRIAVKLNPRWAEAHYNLGVALTQGNDFNEALQAYHTAHRLRPGWTRVNVPLALLLVMSTPVQPAVASEAVRLAEAACRATHHQDAVALYALARAYRAADRPEAARQTASSALDLANTAGHMVLAQRIAALFPTVTSKEPVHAMP